MPGHLTPGLRCPVCGLSVLLVFNEWRSKADTCTREYHHHEDAARDRRGEAPAPCTVVLTYDEGLRRWLEDEATDAEAGDP